MCGLFLMCEVPPYRNHVPGVQLNNHSKTGRSAILCTGELDVIQKEAWPFYRTSSGVHLCWELEEPNGPTGAAPSSYAASVGVRDGRFFCVSCWW